jgi:ATP-dependent Clp protease ATP-binding subunit ClpB
MLESSSQPSEIEPIQIWQAIALESQVVKKLIQTSEAAEARSNDFEPLQVDAKAADHTRVRASKTSNLDSSKTNEVSEYSKVIENYTTDISAQAARGELDPVMGRDAEIRRVLQILGRRRKNNPVLIGEPGVGKTAIVEGIALRIAADQVPTSLRGIRLLQIDVPGLIAGAKFRGEFEDRMQKLLIAAKSLQGKVIFFIDELHTVVGAGNNEGGVDVANILKPALARGELTCIGATTVDEFRRHIEKDAALERRFQPVLVEEPSEQICIGMLRSAKSKYELHHGIKINDDAVIAAVTLSSRYLPNRRLPDKAIDLLDEASTRLKYELDSVPNEIEELRSTIDRLEIERSAVNVKESNARVLTKLEQELARARESYEAIRLVWEEHQQLRQRISELERNKGDLDQLFQQSKSTADFDFAARIQYQELPKQVAEITRLRNELNVLQAKHNFLRQEVGRREIADVISYWTGVPVQRMLEEQSLDLKNIEDRLAARVVGQPYAIQIVSRALKRIRTKLRSGSRPRSVLMFVGPTGVGKTELAKSIAREVYGDDSKMIRFDMSEFMEAHQVARLIGSPPGYVGFGEGGELTDTLKRRPHSLVLLDEVEKAHPKVMDILLQVFEDGRLTDSAGNIVRCTEAMFVMTSNLIQMPSSQAGTHDDSILRQQLTQFFRPEFVNRFDEIIPFHDLSVGDYLHLVELMVTDLNDQLLEKNIRVTLSERLQEQIVQSAQSTQSGGRGIRRAFERLVVDALSEKLYEFSADQPMKGTWLLDWSDEAGIRWSLDFQPNKYLPPARPA